MSKGSKPRPLSIDRKTFDDNWDRIFGKNKLEPATELSRYWSDDKNLEAIVFKEKEDYFVEIHSNGKFVTKLTKGLNTIRDANSVAENAVIEKWWTEDAYAEEY